METIGEVLKRYREKERQTVTSFSKLTKLPENVITSLESNDFSSLPGDFYIRGYLKTYASYLRLDLSKLIELYQQQLGGFLRERVDVNVRNYNKPKVYVTPKMFKLGAIMALAFVLIGYLVFEVNQIFQPPVLEVTTPGQNLIVTDSVIDIRGLTEREAQVFINDREIFPDANGFFGVTLDLLPGINLIKISAKKTHSRESVIYREILLQ